MSEHFLKRILLLTILINISVFSVYAIEEIRRPEQDDWRVFLDAQNNFNSGNYGKALSLAETAKELRIQNVAWKKYTLDYYLRNSAIKRADDSIEELLRLLKERNARDALQIIDDQFYKYTKESFSNSIKKLRNSLNDEDVYPEAELLIGKIYRLEGENELAFDYLNRALKNAGKLDVPLMEYDILYETADLCELTDRMNEYEETLLKIIAKDSNFNSVMNNSLHRIIFTNTAASVEKFFELYRTDNFNSIKACCKLAEYYENTGHSDKALVYSAFGTLTGVTKIYRIIEERNLNYNYSDIQKLLSDCEGYSDIVSWGNSNGVWELFLLLAQQSSEQGCLVFAGKLYQILAVALPDEYWRLQARKVISLE